jgi:hypothetical protein
MTATRTAKRIAKGEKIKFIILNKGLADKAFTDLEIMNSSAKLFVLRIRAEFGYSDNTNNYDIFRSWHRIYLQMVMTKRQ